MTIDDHTPDEGKCPECEIYGELRYDITTGETDCVNCGATLGADDEKEDPADNGQCPECLIYGQLRYNITTGETDCVDCCASWKHGEKIVAKESKNQGAKP